MRIKTNVKGGRIAFNHNQQIARDGSKRRGLKVRTNLKAGGIRLSNHNQTMLGA
jgi:hypothetical protein